MCFLINCLHKKIRSVHMEIWISDFSFKNSNSVAALSVCLPHGHNELELGCSFSLYMSHAFSSSPVLSTPYSIPSLLPPFAPLCWPHMPLFESPGLSHNHSILGKTPNSIPNPWISKFTLIQNPKPICQLVKRQDVSVKKKLERVPEPYPPPQPAGLAQS